MRDKVARFRMAHVLIAGCLAAVTSAAACSSEVRDSLAVPVRMLSQRSLVTEHARMTTEQQPFRAYEVDSVAWMNITPGNRARFVAQIRGQRTARALVRFTVNEDGSVDTSSFLVITSSYSDFASAVRQFVMNQGFRAAKKDGRAVAQRTQIAFEHDNLRSTASATNGSTTSDSNETGCQTDATRSSWESWSMSEVPDDFVGYLRLQFAPGSKPYIKIPMPPTCIGAQ